MTNYGTSGSLPSTLNASMAAGTAGAYGSFVVVSGAPVSTWPTTYPFTVLIDYLNTSFEAVAVTGPYTGTGPYTFPCIRGIDGTAAVAHTSSAAVVPGMTAQDMGSPLSGGKVDPVNIPWLVVDNSGANAPVIRQGANGPIYRTTGYNLAYWYPPEGSGMTAEQLDYLFGRIAPGSLIRSWAYAPVPGTYSWASTISALQTEVAYAKKYGHRLIFVLSDWAEGNQLYTQTGQPDSSGGALTTTWITAQEYLHSVYGANSFQDWVTLVVETFAAEPTVAIYDIMNEPNDPTTTNQAAWTTFCSTVSGWVKAIAPGALCYLGINTIGNFMGYGNTTQLASVMASLDIIGVHDYDTQGFTSLNGYNTISKPWIADEFGIWAKGHYGAYTDTDVDYNGLPAMPWANQARMMSYYLESVFRKEGAFAALAWSLYPNATTGYGAYGGTGGFEPIDQAPAHQVLKHFPAMDHPVFDDTLLGSGNMLSWVNSSQAYRYPAGSIVYAGASSALQQLIYDAETSGAITGPASSGNGPIMQHLQVVIQAVTYPSIQFTGAQYIPGGTAWEDSGSATWFMVIYPTALPGSGLAYLTAPTTNVAGAAVGINSSGFVELVVFGGAVIATSTQALTVNQPNLVMASWKSGASGSYRVDVNTVITSGTSTQAYTTAARQFGANYSGASGFNGHLLELLGYKVVATEGQVSMVNAYLTGKYGLQF